MTKSCPTIDPVEAGFSEQRTTQPIQDVISTQTMIILEYTWNSTNINNTPIWVPSFPGSGSELFRDSVQAWTRNENSPHFNFGYQIPINASRVVVLIRHSLQAIPSWADFRRKSASNDPVPTNPTRLVLEATERHKIYTSLGRV
jgi:hypothetical protein